MKNKDWVGLAGAAVALGSVLQGIYETSKPGHLLWREFQPENRESLVITIVLVGGALLLAVALLVSVSALSKKFSKKV